MSRKRAIDARESADPKFRHWKSRFKAATAAFEMGKLAEARSAVYLSLMEAESLPDRSFAVPVCHVGMAVISMHQGNQKEAKEFFDKGINALSHQSAADTSEVYAAGLRFFAIWHEQNGDLEEAERCLRESVSILQELGNESAVQLAYSLSDLCYILVMRGQMEEAGTLIRSATEILAITVGEDDPSYDWAKIIYQVCLNKHDQEMLQEMFEDSMTVFQYKVGAKHPNLVRALNAYAAALKKRGLTEKLEGLKKNFSALL